MSEITVRPVLTRKDERAFIKFQWKPYVGNAYWVPPLLMDRRKLIDRKHNPFYRHASMELFLAEREGKIVGRIGAIVNDNHNTQHQENIGFFGFFECIDDQAVANALFDAAKECLTKKGVTAMRGPASPSVNDEYGLLIDGFDKPPAVLMAYNPPYYQNLIEKYGFTKIKDLYAFYVHRDRAINDRMKRTVELAQKRRGLVFRSMNMKRFDEDAELIWDLYSRGWARNWGAVSMTREEFQYVAKDLKALVDPELVVFAESKGKPVGFGLSLPDYNMILKHNKRGWLMPALVRIFLFRKKINFTRIMILGVLPEYLNSGIGGMLFHETAVRGVGHGYFHGEASWVLEDNVMMNRGTEMFGGERYKTYRVYQTPV